MEDVVKADALKFGEMNMDHYGVTLTTIFWVSDEETTPPANSGFATHKTKATFCHLYWVSTSPLCLVLFRPPEAVDTSNDRRDLRYFPLTTVKTDDTEILNIILDWIYFAANTTANLKPELGQLQQTLQLIAPIIDDVVKFNQILDRSEQQSAMFIDRIQDAEKQVQKCSKIKRNLKLKDANNKLLRFFQLEFQAYQSRDIRQTLVENSLSVSSRYELIERGKLGWRVPLLPGDIVTFDEPLKKLKAKVFEDLDAYDDGSNGNSNSMEIDDDDGGDRSSVVVVAAAGGCGKTTLVTMLCHDSDILGKIL
ncbi:hypothetical protein E3N88_28137 [Mikania micrantha]|uniref:RPW8 domain-containing protein n=1 Tax=Mikania micrantha TaxID=192012 RepID=A0A5N6MZN3_9ASTR|nr:hypothetical protein E3N88_28137 [Mikania micrantha]